MEPSSFSSWQVRDFPAGWWLMEGDEDDPLYLWLWIPNDRQPHPRWKDPNFI